MRVTFDKKTPVLVQADDEPRMVEEERELGPQGEELRYSPDQPRDPDGKFGSGLGSEADAKYDPSVAAPDLMKWQGGEHQTMQAESEIALKAGNGDKDPVINAIRHERFDGMIHRGLSVEKGDPLLSVKANDVIQIEPSSFSFDRGIADEFSTQTQMPGEVPVILTVGPWGNGIVVGDRGDPEYGPNGYDQKEVITGGHFRVATASNKRGPDGVYRLITMRQVGVF